jgi:chromosome segregation ATPase
MNAQIVNAVVDHMVNLSRYQSNNRHEIARARRQIEEAEDEIKRLQEETAKLEFKFHQAQKELDGLFMHEQAFRYEIQGQLYLFEREPMYGQWTVTYVSNVTLDALLEDEVEQ